MLYDNGLIYHVPDLYTLTYEKLIGLEKVFESPENKKSKKISFQDKTVNNILKGIEQSKNVPFDKVLFALGIRYVGETVAKKLAKHFKSIDNIMSATFEELLSVEEIGEKIANSILKFFSDENNINTINKLKSFGIQMELYDDKKNINNVLNGKTFVVSGVFNNFSRESIKQSIENHGGKVSGSISSKTDFLLAGNNMGPEKLKKATSLNIPIISEEEYLEMIKQI